MCTIWLAENARRKLEMLDKKSTSSGIAELLARYQLKARTGGEEGRYLLPRLVQNLESKSVREKKKR